MSFKLFGFSLGKKDLTQVTKPEQPVFSLPQPAIEDGAITITQGAYYGTYVDLEGSVRNEIELITRYREMSLHPECEQAITEIVSEAFTMDVQGQLVSINLDKLQQPETIKKKIRDEFDSIKRMLNFSNLGDEIFKRWYIDGRLYYHAVVDQDNPKQGIKELRFIDPRKIRKVREIQKQRDIRTGLETIKAVSEYYVFNERGLAAQSYTASVNQGSRIAPDSVINVNSGMMDGKNVMVVSYLHKAIKALNQLRMIEDAVVIYRLSRAPERRVFYIDVGNLPKLKAEQYLRDIMIKYRNKLVYDASTGEIRDERKHLSMLEDFWLPRREGGRGTEITTLPAGQNLGQIDDVIYFRKVLYKALNVPVTRLDPEAATGGGMMGLGRVAEITRDEVRFAKFVNRLRNRFSMLFDAILRVQLSLKGICTIEEWEQMQEFIKFDYVEDNNFAEMRDAELLRERINTLQVLQPFIGVYYSQKWVKKNVLMMNDETIETMQAEIDEEGSAPMPEDQQGMDQNQNGDVQAQNQDQDQEQSQESDTESLTPELDELVSKYSNINRNNKLKAVK
jgi:hypothetical protein